MMAGKGPKVHLFFYETYLGANVGIARKLASLKLGKTNKVQNRNFGWHVDIEAACAEIVVAKYLDLFWNGSINTFKLPDVGEFQVRQTQHENGRLPLHRSDDPNAFYILVTGHTPDYWIRGYILAKDGMKQEYWDNPAGTYPAFFVPQDVLKPIDDLKKGDPGNENL